MRYPVELFSTETCDHIPIYKFFDTRKEFLKFMDDAHQLVCANMGIDPKKHHTNASIHLTIYPDWMEEEQDEAVK